MAFELLNPNGDSSIVWTPTPGGTSHIVIDETIASVDDADYIQSTTEGDIDVYDIENSVVADADTVIAVRIRFRGKTSGAGTNSIGFEVFLNSTWQTQVNQSVANDDTEATYLINDASWNSDWTAADMDALQVRVQATQMGKPSSGVWTVTCFEVEIEYTPSGGADPASFSILKSFTQQRKYDDAWRALFIAHSLAQTAVIAATLPAAGNPWYAYAQQ